MHKKLPRSFIQSILAIGVIAFLAFAFWPRPIMVDMGTVVRGPMMVTINEEGRTRVHDAYILSTPVAGRLQRVEVLPGDKVERGETVVARMLPSNPEALDIRSYEQARADVASAEAALRLARAELNATSADRDLAESEVQRVRELRNKAMASQVELDRAVREIRTSDAAFSSAEATIAMREAGLANARARLISFRDDGAQGLSSVDLPDAIPLRAPASGRVLRVLQESETTLTAGTPILEIGNIENDLEVLIELLSTDAVKVSRGDRVIFEDWGGPNPLAGVVERVEPLGFTKFSALGVEEQRVNTIVRFTDPDEARSKLGHGYRVEARIVIWEEADVAKVPSSALFRVGDEWAVFAVRSSKARLQTLRVGYNNGVDAQLLAGLADGDRVVLYPASGLTDGVAIEKRKVN
ncbi:MAG: HlyD family efflux transporter periplasmic adaptor subunit [Congregibacter sp.]|nr:HlyD family efflux transporter periplasmic adaptor subunit [Congregibacter sp.]